MLTVVRGLSRFGSAPIHTRNLRILVVCSLPLFFPTQTQHYPFIALNAKIKFVDSASCALFSCDHQLGLLTCCSHDLRKTGCDSTPYFPLVRKEIFLERMLFFAFYWWIWCSLWFQATNHEGSIESRYSLIKHVDVFIFYQSDRFRDMNES